MTDSLLIQAIVKRLEQADFEVLPSPFSVASVPFEFTKALRGKSERALDLVLLIDTSTGRFGDTDSQRVRERIEALSQALDVTGSRYVVTVIVAGAVLASGDTEALTALCRVLTVRSASLTTAAEPIDAAARRALEDAIRVLLPLRMEDFGDEVEPEDGSVLKELREALPPNCDPQLVKDVLAASSQGSAAVTRALGRRLANVLAPEPPK
ncbi:MAG: hypothetical protein BGN86_02800 [Caulobacterales bacterium 68-7]|nr:MAG: hypothetical protein BGN86_02800 [Caulobacterales bacterium 68-7]